MFQYYAFSVFENWGFLDFLLPFILIFTLTYAILRKTKFFNNKSVVVAISLVIGLSTVIQHVLYPTTYDPVTIINSALGQFSMIIVAVFLLLLIVGLIMGKTFNMGSKSSSFFTLLSFAIVIFIFGNAAGWWGLPNFLYFLADPDLQALIIVILVFWLIINFITKDKESSFDINKSLEELGKELFKSKK